MKDRLPDGFAWRAVLSVWRVGLMRLLTFLPIVKHPFSLSGSGASDSIRTPNLRRLPLLHVREQGEQGDAGNSALGRDPVKTLHLQALPRSLNGRREIAYCNAVYPPPRVTERGLGGADGAALRRCNSPVIGLRCR